MEKIKLVLVGGGDRGKCYIQSVLQLPHLFEVTAIAEPIKEKREHLQKILGLADEFCFSHWDALFKKGKIADGALICTQDRYHFEPAIKALRLGYHLLLEKPISPSPKECLEIARESERTGKKVLVCHVLRYTTFYKKIKELLDEGAIGKLINAVHIEGIGHVHMSHSFVRGNFRREEESSPMFLAKCCHDTDLLAWLFGEPCTKVHSFGSLSHFNKENAPENAPLRCTDGCPHAETCHYYAPRVYSLNTEEMGHFRSIVAGKFDPTDEEMEEILKTSPYGRCVYHCDNDACDNQSVNLAFGENKHATIMMSAFNEGGRTTCLMGTNGEIRAHMESGKIELYDFKSGKTRDYSIPQKKDGHGGGDLGIMEFFHEYLTVGGDSTATADFSAKTHLIAFGAEKSRKTGKVIDMDEFVKETEKDL